MKRKVTLESIQEDLKKAYRMMDKLHSYLDSITHKLGSIRDASYAVEEPKGSSTLGGLRDEKGRIKDRD